ncbi:ATP synthase F1 subunit epsilon [Candidatus Pelagibacter sp.]|nr:ATP synthase F1 subunit epsilon [Candidatus Pelagibacter sp.]
MSDSFNLEIVNPEKLFLSLDNVSEVVVPAFEGDMGILKDHISIISFLKPGIVKVFTGNEVKELYVEDGIIEFSENSLSILTSRIIDIKKIKKDDLSSMINEANEALKDENLDDQKRFIANQKIDVLNRLN